jgi:hypothetical protein
VLFGFDTAHIEPLLLYIKIPQKSNAQTVFHGKDAKKSNFPLLSLPETAYEGSLT